MLDSYAAGVNEFVRTAERPPAEYKLVGSAPDVWEPWDCLAVYMVRHVMMGGFESKLWRAVLVDALGSERAASLCRGYQPGHPLIISPGEIFAGDYAEGSIHFRKLANEIAGLFEPDGGSNSWALGPGRTSTGAPLLVGDPHRGLDVPNVYYQNQVSCPQFDAIGLSFPGCPGFPHFGHSERVAWCVTHAMADYQDLYVERFSGDDPDLYLHRGEWERADISTEKVSVRGGEEVGVEVVRTLHGPVIWGDRCSGKAVSMRYTALDAPNPLAEHILAMLTVSTAEEMDAAMEGWVDPSNNFLIVDTKGGLRYLNRGQVPVRPEANYWLPVPGWTGDYEWEGFIEHADLPRIVDPPEGLIVTANQKIVGPDYPHLLSLDYAPGYRAERILARLSDPDSPTPEQAAAVHAERMSVPATVYVKLLDRASSRGGRWEEARSMLKAWNCAMEPDSPEPLIYAAMRLELNRQLAQHCLGDLATDAMEAAGRGIPAHLRQLEALFVAWAQEGNTSMLPDGTDWPEALADALEEGLTRLSDRLGHDMESWAWGEVHRTSPVHTLSPAFPEHAELLNPPSAPIGGDADTPQAGFFDPADPFRVMSTSVARYLFDLSDWDRSKWVVPLGSSGHPGSAHYADQVELWRDVKMAPMTYSQQEVRAEARTIQRLNPR